MVSWSNPGNKPVSATNSACGSALGLKGVTISGTGALGASFSYSPSSPQPGQVVTFDASSSTGRGRPNTPGTSAMARPPWARS